MRHNDLFVIVLLAALCAFSGVAATAADAPKPSATTAGPATVSDRELTAFVKAYVQYQKIRSSYGPALEKAGSPERKKQIEQEANAKVKRSLDANGLTPERYNRIFATVNGNEALRKKVLQRVEEERKNS
ncbi:MAG TPA: DUF4168 domain-containing protein [Candidatus Binatia bacterium]